MRKIILALAVLPLTAGAQSLDECQQAAERNYPLIRQYNLIGKTTELAVANIGKEWLPQVSAQAQATLQSGVAAWPDGLQAMMGQAGIDVKGLGKSQYRVGIDVSQTLFDGGSVRSRQAIARWQGQVQEAETGVALYQVHRRVNEMYFGLLLLDERIRLNRDLQELLAGNERKLAAMYQRGTAAESDYNSVKAERLGVVQQTGSLEAQRQTLARLLGTFCGLEIKEVRKPLPPDAGNPSPAALPTAGGPAPATPLYGNRPELRLADARLRLADAQERALDAGLLPRLTLFAQGFYGYPGFNMFEDMMRRDWSLNGLVGARLTWNIGALYTRKNDKDRLRQQRGMAETGRDVFIFNNRLDELQQREDVERYRRLMAADEELIALRRRIRQAAESKLEHGIIDVNDLVREINNENAARVQQSVHEVELLKEMYDLKFTTHP